MSEPVVAAADEPTAERSGWEKGRQYLVMVAILIVFSLLTAHLFGTTVSSKFSQADQGQLCTF